ncbi:hypothetical protein SanaruYs_35670 [Chryseotalea sanaruensis]|uniref:Uncharacterized protein n=1 Tax=Chryseotalea sanaruensis TaxID=2482724 RepID=A0A401UEP9_9BACT|nr:hypothetical protein [Chryseotalea sanaruensis]GCC53324.1 hypothetical protein SanaruYs_35670 [Chryseotalea sanaruensis]
MKNIPSIVTYLILLSFLKCNSQNEILIRPNLEFTTRIGERNYFEKDLTFIKGILDNDLYSVQRYSFLPETVFSENNKLIFFDKFSLNLMEYDCKTKGNRNIFEISNQLKSIGDYPNYRIELIDVNSGFLSFYSMAKNELILFNRNTNKLFCRTQIPMPLFVASSLLSEPIKVSTHSINYKLTQCELMEFSRNKNIPANSNGLFLKHDDRIYYQSLEASSIISAGEVNQLLTIDRFTLNSNLSLKNFDLIHINEKYFVLASNPEHGLGKLIFFERGTGNHYKTLTISPNILSNKKVDFYNAISDYPSPDSDESTIYLRITSLNNTYYLMFQSDYTIKIYSFEF